MRTSIVKITAASCLLFLSGIGNIYAAPSRFDCLVKLGNNATKEDIDSCVKGNSIPNTTATQGSGIDSSSEESVCADLGFKRKTEPFANCVLELLERKDNATASNDPDDATCRKYGFKRKSNEYATCRQQIDQARAQERQRQAQFNAQQAQYQEQLAAYKKQKSEAAGLALMGMGLGMMSNTSPMYGGAPVAPVAPQMGPRTYILPGNRTMTCNTTGNITNCF